MRMATKSWHRYDEGRELLLRAGVRDADITPHTLEVAAFFAEIIQRDVASRAARLMAEEFGSRKGHEHPSTTPAV